MSGLRSCACDTRSSEPAAPAASSAAHSPAPAPTFLLLLRPETLGRHPGRLRVDGVDLGELEVGVYCPECAEREFCCTRANGTRSAAEHLQAALDAWSSAGAYDPAGPLEADLHGLSQPADGSLADAVRETLDLKERLEPALASDGAARDEA